MRIQDIVPLIEDEIDTIDGTMQPLEQLNYMCLNAREDSMSNQTYQQIRSLHLELKNFTKNLKELQISLLQEHVNVLRMLNSEE
jgi:hypothetical protein